MSTFLIKSANLSPLIMMIIIIIIIMIIIIIIIIIIIKYVAYSSEGSRTGQLDFQIAVRGIM